MQPPAVETPPPPPPPPPPEELPAELPSPELPEGATLPEPPVEVEASGSDTKDLEDLLQPAAPTAAAVEVSPEETSSEEGLIIESVTVIADTISDAETKEVDFALVREEPTTAILEEVVVNKAEIPEELEVSTVAAETTEEEVLPALVEPPEAVDVASEASEPEAADVDLPSVDEDSVEVTEEESNLTDVPSADVDPEQPAEEADVNVVLTYPEEPVLEEEATVSEGPEVIEESVPEAPPIEEEGPAVPEISTEDLTEDEIILVNQDEPEPPVTDPLIPAQPTALSPERESPFTRISIVDAAPEGQPDIIVPSLVEVKQNYLNKKRTLTHFS